MIDLGLLFDGLVAVALPVIAWRAIASRELTHAVVLFVALGLLTAVAWARLGAFDVALVEAAVGAGLTGALLMSTIPWADASVRWSGRRPTLPATAAAALAAIAIAAILGAALLALPTDGSPLAAEVARTTPASAATHPVTAVLLDFRGYDTLLEVAVLVVSALGAQALHAGGSRYTPPVDARRAVLLAAVADLLVPASVLVAGYLVWKGSAAPGGAFQASAILAGAGILWLFSRRAAPAPRGVLRRTALLAGLALFAVLAAVPLLAGGALLDHPDHHAATLIVALEVTLALSLGVALVLFHPASAPDPAPGRPR